MHIPNKFKQDDAKLLEDIIRQYSFATLITQSKMGLEANHIPFFLHQEKGKNILQGHIAKANPLWKNVDDQSEVLITFNGPNYYISPNYYPTKKVHGKAVPTWNYISVHVRGKMSYIHDNDWNLAMLHNLSDQHEAKHLKPWSVSDAPEDYIQKMMTAIVGLEIHVSSITGQWKLSQNQPDENKHGAIKGLYEENVYEAEKMAELIKKYALGNYDE